MTLAVLLGPLPAISLVDFYLESRREGESAFDWSHRVLVYDAMRRKGLVQSEAAELLRLHRRVVNYHLQLYAARPKDRRVE